MKILLAIDGLRQGGKERRFLELLIALAEDPQVDVRAVVFAEDIGFSIPNTIADKIDVYPRRHRYDPRPAFKLLSSINKWRPDVVHSWGVLAALLCGGSLLMTGSKAHHIASVITDTTGIRLLNLKQRVMFELAVFSADAVVSNTKLGLSRYPFIVNRAAFVIPNGVRVERFIRSDVVERTFPFNSTKFNRFVVMVAAVRPHKDFDFFIDVAKQMRREYNDVAFVGIGGGELAPLVERVRDEVIENVFFLGPREDVELCLSWSDVGVLFPDSNVHGEGISNSIVEYMFSGIPTVTTDYTGASCEIIDSGVEGFIVEPRLEIVSTTIGKLLEDKEFGRAMGARAKARALAKLSIATMVERHKDAYSGGVS